MRVASQSGWCQRTRRLRSTITLKPRWWISRYGVLFLTVHCKRRGRPIWFSKLRPSQSASLEIADPVPVFVCAAFRASFLLPQGVRTSTETFVTSPVPEFRRPSFRPTFLFPQRVGAFADDAIEISLRFRVGSSCVTKRLQASAPAHMHSGGHGSKLGVADELLMSCSCQRLRLVVSITRCDA